jgi:acyl carrier protein
LSEDGVDIKENVRQFIIKNFYVPDPAKLTDEVSFLDSGIIDSTSVLELTAFLEETFSIKIADDELLPENLDSLASVAGFITRKTAAGS